MGQSGILLSRRELVRRGRRLEYFGLGWNLLEAVAGVAAGAAAGSTALVGFGLDSLIESFSGATLLWRLHQEPGSPASAAVALGGVEEPGSPASAVIALAGAEDQRRRSERAERTALRLVGFSLLALAAYVVAEAVKTLVKRERPEHSLPGVALAVAALIVMPLLARAKRRVAAGLASGALQADSRQSDLCAYLSAVLLGGLLLNAWLGWWWADPAAALVMTPIIVKEGWAAVRDRSCACCHGVPG